MSKISKAVADLREESELRRDETVVNYMGGDSYTINPLDTLKLVAASSIFGEPAYYEKGMKGTYSVHSAVKEFSVLPETYANKSRVDIMTQAIDDALTYDFGATIEWAVSLRKDYLMRLNPQVIMVRAAMHPNRKAWTEANPGKFDEYNQQIMSRADESMSQMAYYMLLNKGKKNNIPSLLKRSWAKHLSKLSRYKVAKYKNKEIGMINAVRICHANSKVLDELMSTGTVEVDDNTKTWENLRSEGVSWKEICERVDMGHMAKLRNLRGIFTEIEDIEFCKQFLEDLKSGVLAGKQFPFRYYSAIKAIKDSDCHHKPLIMDALEECVDIALGNMPKLKGKTMCLSDNSGSAWGTFNSEYGTVTVAEIDNLSSVLTAAASDEGYVGKFGDKLIEYPVSKRQGILSQAEDITKKKYSDVGGSTEGGIWEFFKRAIDKKEHWDNIFIYSDMQAGHGQLYGTGRQQSEYTRRGYGYGSYVNVFKLIQDYRKYVNPKVNVFCVQTAGYNNTLVPEYAYRTNIMYGWTGKEAVFADAIIKQWDAIENKNK